MPRLISNQYLNEFKERGVPFSVLGKNFPDDIAGHIQTIDVDHDGQHQYIKAKQVALIGAMAVNKKPYLAVLAGQHYDAIPCQTALAACLKSVEWRTDKDTFRWRVLTGQNRDIWRDDETQYQLISQSRLLVFSNVAENSLPQKLEKLRDLLEIYSHIPRIVCLSGVDPVTFCFKQLHMQPHIVGYFGKSGVSHDKEQEED